jgi:hypothetical protein
LRLLEKILGEGGTNPPWPALVAVLVGLLRHRVDPLDLDRQATETRQALVSVQPEDKISILAEPLQEFVILPSLT